jgi:archaellum component FlaF (FlaF/FlaG flagellin family)
MITVGAVGVVYSQSQRLVGGLTEQIDSQRRNQNTDITIVRRKSNDTSDPNSGQLILEVQNTGSVTRNTSAFRLITDDPSMAPGDGGMVDGFLSINPENSTLLDLGRAWISIQVFRFRAQKTV